MAAAKPIPAPRNSEEKPFEIGDTLSVFEAAMVYAGRHPHGRFLKDGDIEDHINFLKAGIRKRERVRARRSWDIYCEIIKRIEQGNIQPIRTAYDPHGRIDPIRTVIRTSDLERLATERKEQPKYLGRSTIPKISNERAAPKSKSGAKTQGTAEAIGQLWPDGIPKGLTAKDRNKAIMDWLQANRCSIPGVRTIQRVLKAQR